MHGQRYTVYWAVNSAALPAAEVADLAATGQ
jgi:hypothetical protein